VLKGWINRGLWNNDTHRALPALYVMKDYLQGSAAINPLIGGQGEVPPPSYYDLQGRQLPFQAKGVCIERRGPVTRKIIQ
jgi:arabinogalactan endo-1,4-beta-galactosidase